MDSTLQTNTDAIISQMWTYFFGSFTSSNFLTSASAQMYYMAAQLMGYGGAALSLFLSIAGAY